jgi:branched-chain amino acid transport system permease protein
MTDAARVREGRETRSRVRLVVFVLVVALFLALWGKDVPIWGGCTAHLTVCGNVFSIGIFQGMIIALIALGYTLVYGILQLINFANGDVFMLGSLLAYESVSIFKALGLPISGSAPIAEIILWLALTLPITMVLTALLNAGIERYAYRPLRRAPTVATLISAIGMSFILQNAGQKVLGASPVSLVQGSDPSILSSADVFVLFGEIHIKFSHLFVTAITIPLLFALVWFVANTRQGKAMRAVAQDREAAGLMGINVDRTISLTFLLAGALAGGAGLIVALYNGQAWWFYGTPFGLQAFTAAVFGGIGNLKGAAVGGIILGIMISLNAYYIDPRWQEVVVFGLLVVVLIFKPTGLFGSAQSERA